MIEQLQDSSRFLVKYWIFVFSLKVLAIIFTFLIFLGVVGSGIDFSNIEKFFENSIGILWGIFSFLIIMFFIVIFEFVLIVKCIKKCNKLLKFNPPLELKERIINQKNRLKGIMVIGLIYLAISIHPIVSSIIFLISLYLKYKFWNEIENII